MKINLTFQIIGVYFSQILKKKFSPIIRKQILKEYYDILARSKNIGHNNPLSSAYALGAWFIAMNRITDLSPQQNCDLLSEGLKYSKAFKMIIGDADHYLSPSRIKKQMKWAKNTHTKQYPNDWVVDCLPQEEDFDLGYDYLECGICKLCHDEGCPHLSQYLCQLDFLFAEIMGLELKRTGTLAQGASKCDFRFKRK